MNRFLMVSLLLTSSLSSARAQALLKNGSFEERDPKNRAYPHYWDQHNQGTAPLQFVGEHRDGATAGMMAGDGKEYMWRQNVIAPKQRGYTLGGFVKSQNVTFKKGDYAYLYGHIIYKGKPYETATHFLVNIPAGTYDWKSLSVQGAAPGADEIELIHVSVLGKFSAGRIWVDKVELTENASLSPEGLLTGKIEDLEKNLARVGNVDATVAKANEHLAAAKRALGTGESGLNPATNEWIAAARALSHDVWAKMFPDAMTDKKVEARMIYHGGMAATEADTNASFNLVQSAGCNGTFHSLGSWGSVIYPSKLIPQEAGYEKRDALKYSIEEAKRRGIKSFAYIASLYGTNSPPTDPNTIYAKHPEWFAKGPDPRMPTFPDPANPEVVDFIVSVYVELATNYDLDGIGLDYIRYPSETALNYDENNRKQIKAKYGIDIMEGGLDVSNDPKKWAKIREYRSEKVANVVKRVRDAVKKVKPDMPLLACLISEPELAPEYGQNWLNSAKWLEYATPMNYDDRSADVAMLKKQHEVFGNHKSIFIPALGGMPEVHQAWPISKWAERVALQRKIGCDGIIIYRMGGFDQAVAAFFGKGPFYGTVKFPEPAKK
jgi:uncharacterized lipoprotein YddW (UPF0748 family)